MSESSRRTSLTARLLVFGTVAALGLILLLTLLVDRSVRSVWLDDLDNDLGAIAAVVRSGLPADEAGRQAWALAAGTAAGVRITVIEASGVVLADSDEDPVNLENHASRPEVAAALRGETGKATRVSASTGVSQRYVALPLEDGIVVRASAATAIVDEELGRTRSAILRMSLLVAGVALGLLFLLGRRASRPISDLADRADEIASGSLSGVPIRSPIAELDRLGMALAGISRDLGGRVEEAERASSLLEVVLGTIPQGTVLFDESDQTVYSNPAAQDILGRVPVALGSLSPFRLQELLRSARLERRSMIEELDHGISGRRIRAVATPFASDERVLLVLADVTERARLDAIRRDFAVNASHELKTPVATIIATSEALNIALSKGDPEAEKFAARIGDSSRQLERLVTDLLDLSRLEREAPELLPLRLDQVIAEEVARIRSRAEDNGLIVSSDLVSATVEGSRRDLALAVRNLLDNAIRHTPAGGSITVQLARSGAEVRLKVIDTGEGVPTKDINRVFERFYRVDSARSRDTGGTGLGLAIVKHVAETHGGSVSLSSELGRGSTFTVVMPLSANEASGDN